MLLIFQNDTRIYFLHARMCVNRTQCRRSSGSIRKRPGKTHSYLPTLQPKQLLQFNCRQKLPLYRDNFRFSLNALTVYWTCMMIHNLSSQWTTPRHSWFKLSMGNVQIGQSMDQTFLFSNYM